MQQAEDDSEKPLFSPWVPEQPTRQPTARGQWVWLPDPSEIRGNGFFDPNAVDQPCDIGPCQLAEEDSQESNDDIGLLPGCPHCQAAHGQAARGRAAFAEPLPPVPQSGVDEVADLMARGPRATEGTLFADTDVDCPGCNDLQRQAARRRQTIHNLQQVEAHVGPEPTYRTPGQDQMMLPAPTAEQTVADSIRTLRETAFDLDVAAQRMEDQQLYYRADQLREYANQLRQEARSALGGWSLKRLQPYSHETPVGAERDLGLELEQLRDELFRVRETLKQQAEPAPRR